MAQAYVDALLSHDPSEVPFAKDAVRYEAGLKTGFSGAHLRRSLKRGPQYRLVRDISPVEWSVDGDVVYGVYTLASGAFGRTLTKVEVREWFTIPAVAEGEQPQIHKIVVKFG